VDILMRSVTGLTGAQARSSGSRPRGVLFFAGPTGVGKTELAKTLTQILFGDESAYIRFDMSEFKEEHSAALLYGAPPGYVGYEEGGMLVNKIRQQPYAIVLFDEIEKAHPDVFQLLLQLLEEGKLTDAKGREVSFRNTIIILTSNLGADKMMKESELGFRSSKQRSQELDTLHNRNASYAMEALEKFMRPELINRFDGIVTFRALTRDEVGKIFDLLIEELRQRLVRKGLGITVSAAAKRQLIDKGYSAKFGARPLRRVIEDEVEHAIAERLLAGSDEKGAILEVGWSKGEVQIEQRTESVASVASEA